MKYLHISFELRSSETLKWNTVVCGPHALNCVRPRNDSRLKDILNFADSRVLGDRLYAAQCSDPGYASVKPLLESRAQPWAVDFLMEVAC